MDTKIVNYSGKEKVLRIIFILVIIPFLTWAAWCGYNIYHLASERSILKKDYSEMNNIQHGLLSVNAWRDHITEIVNTQIEDFELSGMQEDTLKSEINKILNSLISQADNMINEKQTKVGGKLKKFAFNALVNVDKVRERVPEFSQTIINEIKRPRSKQKLKFLAQDKLNDFASQTKDSIVSGRYGQLLSKYKTSKPEDLNRIITDRAEILQDKSYNYTYVIIGIVLLFLLIWRLVRKSTVLHTPLFTLSVLLALVCLIIGLAAPMIEIDARIQELNFVLIGKSIHFHDQVLFYQSKSIIDVVIILIETRKPDSVLVGLLILIFSIVFPIAKLLSAKLYLLGNERWRNSKIIKFFAFKSGKWSMADVMVVAIFMAYIGFKGILDSQLSHMNMKNEQLASIATNKTSLQPGFILFITFVLFGLVLSVILKKISPDKNKVALEADSKPISING